jgi:hypothetical protein
MLVARQILRPFINLRSISACRLHSSTLICRSSAVGGIENAHKLAELSAEQKNQVELYLDTLFDWNTRMNLTGRSSQSPPPLFCFIDSYSLEIYLPLLLSNR